MSNTISTTGSSNNQISCNSFNPEYCLYKLPCGTCMMLKSACPHITNKLPQSNTEQYKLPDSVLATSWGDDIPTTCKYCLNHPNNGGSGICNCTLGQRWNVTC